MANEYAGLRCRCGDVYAFLSWYPGDFGSMRGGWSNNETSDAERWRKFRDWMNLHALHGEGDPCQMMPRFFVAFYESDAGFKYPQSFGSGQPATVFDPERPEPSVQHLLDEARHDHRRV